jgi:DNA polymerase I-like protein with 3'-5' exonuclease and polymerase domains
MGNLFSLIDDVEAAGTWADWRPEAPPSLDGIDELELDFETDGLKWWDGNKPVGVGYWLPDGRHGYLPWGHRTGYNLPFETVQRWLQREVRGKQITNSSIKFEVHMARNINVDFEAQGNKLYDVQHWAALLDDHRKVFNQAALMFDYNIDDEKILEVNGIKLDPSRMAEYPSGMVAVRCIGDVRGVNKLKQVMRPMLIEQDLERVAQLESELIYPVCEMERNGAPVNVELLHRWCRDAQREYEQCLWQIFRETGLKFNPDSRIDWTKLFNHLKLPIQNFTDAGRPSFTAAILKQVDHPLIKLGMQAGHLADLLSKYLLKYAKTIGSDGILRYAMHQLRGDEGGTVSGRFSSAAFEVNGEDIGANIQQVLSVDKQLDTYGPDYIIRELFVPGSGLFASADAAQVEYRKFADYAKNPKMLAAYRENPRLKFHDFIWEMLKPFKPDLKYKPLKNLNFARMYGAQVVKIAQMMEYISESDARELNNIARRKNGYKQMLADPRLAEPLKVLEIYDREMPEIKPLLRYAAHLAKSGCDDRCLQWDDLHKRGIPHRGYIKTALGRRMRFPDNWRLHKALNGAIQGSCADLLKLKIIEVYKERKRLGFTLRHTEHDEICGDIIDRHHAELLGEVLDQQSLPGDVPILWEWKIGANWRECA